MKAGKKAYCLGLGEVVVLEYGKGATARVRHVDGKKATELDVEKTNLVAKPPKPEKPE